MSDLTHKVILVGNFGVGKTSITKRFVENIFSEEPVQETVDQFESTINVNGTNVKLKIGDTAGGEKFRTLTSGYFRNAEGVLVVFDVTNKESYEDLGNCFQEAEYYAPSCVKILVANKVDLPNRLIAKEDGKSFADGKGVPYFEVSAKTGDGVKDMWTEMAKRVANVADTPPPAPASSASGNKASGKKEKKEGGGCMLL